MDYNTAPEARTRSGCHIYMVNNNPGNLMLLRGTYVINGNYDLGGDVKAQMAGYEDSILTWVMTAPADSSKYNYNQILQKAETILREKIKLERKGDLR